MTAWNDSPGPEFYEAPDPPGADETDDGVAWCQECGRPRIESTVFVGCACPEDED